MEALSNVFIKVDQTLDFVPVVSTITNIVGGIAQIALAIYVEMTGQEKQEILRDKPFLRHLDQKDLLDRIFLAIPFFNCAYADARYCDLQAAEIRNQADQLKIEGYLGDCQNLKEKAEKPKEEWTDQDVKEMLEAVQKLQSPLDFLYQEHRIYHIIRSREWSDGLVSLRTQLGLCILAESRSGAADHDRREQIQTALLELLKMLEE